ncbi:hypothetical protein F2Q69_00031731 [Brassica cretica]|uniref:Uncharacterized protein n=1 Tax=Brassica cretica TaxID=69181 RepID=A0A8S9RTK0_BRACR|nr:hypothetical protein F2Q69_00031731 [Brassica cretica]
MAEGEEEEGSSGDSFGQYVHSESRLGGPRIRNLDFYYLTALALKFYNGGEWLCQVHFNFHMGDSETNQRNTRQVSLDPDCFQRRRSHRVLGAPLRNTLDLVKWRRLTIVVADNKISMYLSSFFKDIIRRVAPVSSWAHAYTSWATARHPPMTST